MEATKSTLPYPASLEDIKRVGFLNKAGLSPPPGVPLLAKLPPTDPNWWLPEYADLARARLVEYRKTGPERKPEDQKRDFFRLPHQKRRARDEASWTFKKREVAHTLDILLSRAPLPPAGVLRALLSHVSLASLDELWCHFNDRKLEKRMKSFFRKEKKPNVPEIPWLDRVTVLGNVDYVRLLCRTGLAQDALDRAFSIALAGRAMEVMEVLLTYDATISACQDRVCERIQLDDTPLARLLLSAPPAAMSLATWRRCFSEEMAHGEKFPLSTLLLCVSQRQGIVCGPLLLKALEARNFQATATLLAYLSPENNLKDLGQSVCHLASSIENAESRHDYFDLLADAGLVFDHLGLRKELMADIEARHFPLVRILVDSGVALDVDPYNAIAYIVSKMDLDMLDWVQGGRLDTPAVLALHSAPESTPEPQLLRLITVLAPRGLEGEALDAFLIRAARSRHVELARLLVDLGASVEYDMAGAIKVAVEIADLSMLDVLLQGSCSPNVLSSALPTAMAMQSRPSRQYAINALISKGVLEQELGISLQTSVAEAGDIDLDLVRLLVSHGAPVEGVGDDTTNAVLQAARRCKPAVLQLLCFAKPGLDTFSKAVPLAFQARHTCEHDAVLEMLRLLFEHGANGKLVHKTLLSAVIHGDRHDIVHLLVKHGADANFGNGAAFEVALMAANVKLLKLICLGCPPTQETIISVLYRAIDPSNYRPEALELLLGSARSAAAALVTAWDTDKFRGNPNLNTIVPCLLRHGLDVNLRDGALVCFAVQEKDVKLLGCILSSCPSTRSLTEAFKLTHDLEPRGYQIQAMSMLLKSAKSVEIGQSRVLLQQTYNGFTGDIEGVRLLLEHGAAVDFDDGVAVRVAASAGQINVLDRLLAYSPTVSTLHKACLAAAADMTLSPGQRRLVFDKLLDARDRELTEAEHMSHLLAQSIIMLPHHEQLPSLLIKLGVRVQFETLTVAMRTSSSTLFKALADAQNPMAIVVVFNEAMKATMEPDRKYWVCEYLLGRGLPDNAASIALIDCMASGKFNDLAIPKLLLEHGADVGYRECAAFSCALSANSLLAVKLLSQYLLDDDTACFVFDLTLKTVKLSRDVRAGVYSCLLQWNISTPLLYNALIRNMESPHTDTTIVQLLLNKGADPNQNNAHCFVLAVATGKESIYRALSRRANLSVVLRVLLDHFQAEEEVLLWFNRCLEEQHHSATIDEHGLLYQCMRKFPSGCELLRVILSRGVSPATFKPMVLCGGDKPEPCTPLIWALFAGIKNDAIFALLEFAGHQG